MSTTSYTLRVRCPTWAAVESFYRDRVRPGPHLAARVPFVPQRGDRVVVALELPDQVVMAIDGVVRELGHSDGVKTPILIRLVGFDTKTVGRLEQLVREGEAEAVAAASRDSRGGRQQPPRRGHRPPPPRPEDAPVDIRVERFQPPDPSGLGGEARAVYDQLVAELAQLRELPAHEVVGAADGARSQEVRQAYFEAVKRLHPDVVARYAEPAVTHAASELFIFVNRAYDRVRSAARAAGLASEPGPALSPGRGWLIDLDDLGSGAPRPGSGELFRVRIGRSRRASAPAPVPTSSLTAEELFRDLGGDDSAGATYQDNSAAPADEHPDLSELIAEAAAAAERGDQARAAQLYAEALQVDPRDRHLRARYHASRGRQLVAAGDPVRATTQLELALAHDPDNATAAKALAELRGAHRRRKGRLSRWFQK